MRPLILITRPPEHADTTARDVEALGFEVMRCPVLTVKPQTWNEPNWDGVRALIVTSRNALASFAGHHVPKDKPVFAVGGRTSEALKAEGFTNILAVAETSADLPALIQSALPGSSSLLHLASEDAHTGFYQKLQDAGYTLETVNLYKAEAVTELPADAREALLSHRVSGVLFYSARSCAVFLNLLQRHGLADACEKTTAFCLSDAVASEALAGTWKNIRTSEKPTHESLLERLAKTPLQGHHPTHPADSEENPMPPAAEIPKTNSASKGGAMAAFAVLFALLTLGLSGYTVWLLRFSGEDQTVSPLLRQEVLNETHVKALINQAFESHNRMLNDDLDQFAAHLEKLSAKLDHLAAADKEETAKPSAPAPNDEKLRDVIVAEQTRQAGLLSALTQLDFISQQLRAGRNFHASLSKLKESLPQEAAIKEAVNALEALPGFLAGDDALIEQLRALEPAFKINEKIKDTPSVMDKLSLEVQKLVVVRPKDDHAPAETPQQQSLRDLQQAIAVGDWVRAETLAGDISKNAPEGFAALHEALKARRAAEKNAATVRNALFDAIKSGLSAAPSSTGAVP